MYNHTNVAASVPEAPQRAACKWSRLWVVGVVIGIVVVSVQEKV